MKISRRYKIFIALFGFAFLIRMLPYFLQSVCGITTSPAVMQNSTDAPWLSLLKLAALYPWNFSPLYAILLLCGATALKKEHLIPFALLFPLFFQLAGDTCIGLISGHWEWAFYAHQPVIFLSLGLFIIMGISLRSKRNDLPSVAGGGFMAACGFFFVSNFAVWAFGGGTIYSYAPHGLMNCFAAALPFFPNTLIALAVYIPLLFNPWMLRLIEEDETDHPATILQAATA